MNTDTELPTFRCTPRLHRMYGGACFHCCDYCNYDRHICHFCGDNLRHGDTDYGTGKKHGCYARCQKCEHIGHLHYSGRCAECNDCTGFQEKEQTA